MQRRSTRLTRQAASQNESRGKKTQKSSTDSDSDDDFEPSLSKLKTRKPNKKMRITKDDSSSSESDIESYLQPTDKIDLNSSFFKNSNDEQPFENIEKEMFSGIKITRLSDSDSSSDEGNEECPENVQKTQSLLPHCSSQKSPEKKENFEESERIAKLNFKNLQEYTQKLEEAKKSVELYQTKQTMNTSNSQLEQKGEINIDDLLAKCETKNDADTNERLLSGSDSEAEEDWEEINEKNVEERPLVPKEQLEIHVEMPTTMKKKKGIDLLAAVKRRLNRVRKENQVLIHKVHLLCYIAHGNFVNSVLNDESMIALGLSLIPSEKSYPSGRIDLSYLEQILKWYKKMMKLSENGTETYRPLSELLTEQIEKKEASSKRMLVLIFILILRSLGIQCRLVLSLQVEPLRPPSSDLHFLGNSDKKTTSKKPETVKKDSSSSSRTGENYSKLEQMKSPEKTGNEKPNLKNLKNKESHREKSEKKKPNERSDKDKSTGKSRSDSVESVKTKKSDEKKDAKKSSEKPLKKVGLKEIDKKSVSENKKNKSDISEKNKTAQKKETKKTATESKQSETTKSRSKSTSQTCVVNLERMKENNRKTRSKSSSVPQLDGTNNETEPKNLNFEEFYASTYQQISYTFKKIPQLDGVNDEPSPKPNLRNLKNKSKNADEKCNSKNHRRSIKRPTYKDDSSSSESGDEFMESPRKKIKTDSPLPKKKAIKNDVTEDIMKLIKGRVSENKQLSKIKKVKAKKKSYDDTNEDSDFVPEEIPKKYGSDDEFSPNKTKVKRRIPVEKVEKVKKLKKSKDPNSRKVISSDSEYTDVETKPEKRKPEKKKGNDVWIEVFLESEEKWVSVDVIFGQIHCVNEINSRASQPLSYVLAWNNENHVKDITRRYCQNYNTVTRKLRVDSQWWEETMKPFLGPNNARNREEDDELNREQLEKPLPTTISEYKNHPLYALERHLLKFESIYPPNAPPLGFVRNEAVYSRDCVHTLHSRDIWLKQAKVVKLGEKPYKIVKARPKYDKLSNSMITGQNLEIFGPWQVEDYDPPTAENGIVPRNAFGNVDLFKPSMLPKKCVHLQLPGLNKIARRMNIDCASAIVGFDFHSGWSHPVYDGFVVCEEHEDELVAAWNIEQEEVERKEQEKYEKRVYGNWKKLIKGLWIRERLKAKYGFGQGEDDEAEVDEAQKVDEIETPSTMKKETEKEKKKSSKSKKRRVLSSSSENNDE